MQKSMQKPVTNRYKIDVGKGYATSMPKYSKMGAKRGAKIKNFYENGGPESGCKNVKKR